MNLLQHFSSSNYIVFNKIVAKALGINSALMLAELVYEYGYYLKNDMLTNDGFFYSTVHNVEEATTLTKYQQAQSVTKMVELNLIKMVNQGIPCKRYFKLNVEVIESFILNLENEPDVNKQNVDTKKAENRELRNFTALSEESSLRRVKKLDSVGKETSLRRVKKLNSVSKETSLGRVKKLDSVSKETSLGRVKKLDCKKSRNLTTRSQETRQLYNKEDNIKNNIKYNIYISSSPTFDEINSYCRQKNYNVDIAKFIDYYTDDNGQWIGGKTNWKKKLLVWVANEERYNKKINSDNRQANKTFTGTEHNYDINELERVLFGGE